MNNESIVAEVLYLREPQMALNFLVENLGFVIQAPGDANAANGVIVSDRYSNLYEVIMHTNANGTGDQTFEPVVLTTDCLQDFYNVTLKGLPPIKKPHYTKEGLMFKIIDPWNNTYTFLEKRDYTDQ